MTNELIEEIRDFHALCDDPHCDHGEATETEHCVACQAEYPCSAIQAADALAASQPTEDDREAAEAEAFRQYPERDSFGVPDLRVFAFKAGAVWAHSRAAVPDAATEAGRWHLLYEKGVEERVELRAERDAATAALDRVRKYADERSVYAKTRNNTVGSWRIASDLYQILGVSSEDQQALDGAPEPEVKP